MCVHSKRNAYKGTIVPELDGVPGGGGLGLGCGGGCSGGAVGGGEAEEGGGGVSGEEPASALLAAAADAGAGPRAGQAASLRQLTFPSPAAPGGRARQMKLSVAGVAVRLRSREGGQVSSGGRTGPAFPPTLYALGGGGEGQEARGAGEALMQREAARRMEGLGRA